ncbi:fatty acid desaturase [Telmatospirillum sp.]|uniref:fatty acid desaturase n=1 Tax=Telmatospirillum sp. TaxID=2079197 RepID=UPI00284089D4|nr:fatty acid desaturase [Telmatospirillum sp.]MDR3439355.1 fatty acid desaturase [Telmatospirillum sp.]
MTEACIAGRVPTTVEEWNRLLRPYATPNVYRSLTQLAVTLGLLFGCFAGMLLLDDFFGYWAGMLASVPTGLLLVRVFIIQHDCGHHSFFRQRWACDWVGRCLGVLTLTPYLWWKRDHDRHHASSGDLSRRGFGDIDTMTVSEYRALSGWRRFLYRLYRHPVVLFGIGPLYQFLLRHRLPIGLKKGDRRSLVSILATDAAIAILLAGGDGLFGLGRFSALWLPTMGVAALVGVWMFFVQHQFETTYWAWRGNWSFVTAALKGCSYYKLPAPLEWVTGSIGYHHIHHLASRIPNYRLQDCFRDIAPLRCVTVINFRQSLKCARLALWSEEAQRLLSFREANHLYA